MAATSLLVRAAGLFDNRVVAALLSPRHVDDYLGLVSPMLVQRETRARIVAIARPAHDTVTLTLEPNRRFPGFRAGQYVPLTVELDGRRVSRPFSFSCAPESGRVELTIKKKPNGRVSRWANERANVGDVVTLGDPAGDFVLPEPLPPALTFIAAGSGITPIKSLMESALARGYRGPIACLVYAPEVDGALLGEALSELARIHPHVRITFVPTRARSEPRGPTGHYRPAHLMDAQGHDEVAETYVCGPASLIMAVRNDFAARGAARRLHVERFSLDVEPTKAGAHHLTFSKSGVTVPAAGTLPLLQEAEAAGLSPEHGCRIGICHTCSCTLERGTVRDLTTGELVTEPGQRIRLCSSAALSDVQVDL